MASGSARGVRIDQHEGSMSERVTPNKTQIVVSSGSSLYYANLMPAIDKHYMVAIPKFEQTKVRGIVTIPTYLHMALVPMTRFAELNATRVFNN